MTPLTQETSTEQRAGTRLRMAPPPQAPIRNPLPRLRRIVAKQQHPFSWIAAERIASTQARLFRRMAHDAGVDPVALVWALPNIHVRQDAELPRRSARHWDPVVRRWIITIKDDLPETSRRFLILREFKRIIDNPDSMRLYDPDLERGPAQAAMASDHFATCTLMPATAVRDAIRSGITTLSALATHFRVSEYRVSLRLSDLGLTTKIRIESKGGEPS